MLRILVVGEPLDKIDEFILNKANIVATVFPGIPALEALDKYKPDLVISNTKTAADLNTAIAKTPEHTRANVIAKTHQGVQLVPISDIYYFQADDKYVTAHHTQGELLIEDSIASLEHEFHNDFIRIHRKTLVAVRKIEKLFKDDTGQSYVLLRDKKIELAVSRRQLPLVRKTISCL